MSTMNYRKCSKCGKTRAMDPTITYHRFPQPGTTNVVKARAWATYCWPDKEWSYEDLCSLNNRTNVLCGRHFSDSQFYDNKRQHLSKFAVPDSPEVEKLLNNRENIFNPDVKQDKPAVQVCAASSKPVQEQREVADPSTSDMDVPEDALAPSDNEQEDVSSAALAMSNKESKRKCFKCGCSPHVDGVKLFRFPKPSVRNLIRCSLWARFIFPDRDFSSFEFQTKLYDEHRMLCQKHFLDAEFTDGSKQKLLRSAVPSDNKEQDNQGITLLYVSSSNPVEGRRIVVHPSTSDMDLLEDPLASTKKEQIKLEVCIDSLESAVNAIEGGADELELCSALNDGGLTPSVGLVKEALRLVESQSSQTKTKINVMLRCRGGDDFQYTSHEMVTMLSDLEIFKDMGVDRFVFGALTDTLGVDEENCMKVLLKAQPLPVTFHRAFDLCVDPIQSIETIINLGFDRLLTSGQQSTASDNQAIQLIGSLVEGYGEEIEIMPGSGVNCNNVKTFVDLGCSIVHSSCKKNRILPRIEGRDFTMGGTNEIYVTDESVVRQMKEMLQG